MMIEDLYKQVDRLNKHQEMNMALNKVNIEFLQKQMDKALVDIEKLKRCKQGDMNTMVMDTHNDRVCNSPFDVCKRRD